ncbi:MAG: SPFH domain-containing protein [Bacteroidota bacterium]
MTYANPTMSFYLIGFIVAFVLMSTLSIVKIVPESQEWTLERFGKFTRILKPGLHFITPFVDKVSQKISLRERVLDIPPQDIITKDNAMVTVDGVVFYRAFDSKKAAYQVYDLNLSITQLTLTNIRTVMGEMELDHLLSNREVINAKLLKVIDEATDPWGIKVTRIEIKDIQPPKDIQEAMGKQMKAEREKRASILNSQAHREAKVNIAQGEREAAILMAEGARQAVVLEAEANKQKVILEAEARERKAAAEAVALEALGKGNKSAMQYLLSQYSIKSLEALSTSKNHKTIILPLGASNVLGALAGLVDTGQELLKREQAEKVKVDEKQK